MSKLLVLLLIVACRYGIADSAAIKTEFVKAFYERVEFASLRENPVKHSGSLIAVEGYLGRDYDIVDSSQIPALYSRPEDGNGALYDMRLKIAIPSYYAGILRKFGYPCKCIIYGLYIVHPNSPRGPGLHQISRIDRIEADNGKTLVPQFGVEAHK